MRAIVEQHAEDASHLWLLRDRASESARYTLAELAELDGRLEAHLDGLRVAGDAGWAMCRALLERGERGDVFPAAVLAFEGDDPAAVETVVRAGFSAAEAFDELVSALGWVQTETAERWLRPMLRAEAAAYRRLGTAAAAAHRLHSFPELAALIDDADPHTRARAVRAAGALKRRELLPRLAERTSDAAAAVRFWAVWSAVLMGEGAAAGALRAFGAAGGLFAREAAALLPRVVPLAASRDWLRSLAQAPSTARLAVIGCGAAGDPAFVPILIGRMAVPEHARIAGEAFSMITGVDLAYEDLDADPPEDFDAGPTEDPEDEQVDMDPDEDLPWPHRERIERWWAANGGAFGPGRRHLCGRPIDEQCCRRVLRDGTQPQRRAAAYELALANAKAALFAWRAPGFRQQSRLGSGR